MSMKLVDKKFVLDDGATITVGVDFDVTVSQGKPPSGTVMASLTIPFGKTDKSKPSGLTFDEKMKKIKEGR